MASRSYWLDKVGNHIKARNWVASKWRKWGQPPDHSQEKEATWEELSSANSTISWEVFISPANLRQRPPAIASCTRPNSYPQKSWDVSTNDRHHCVQDCTVPRGTCQHKGRALLSQSGESGLEGKSKCPPLSLFQMACLTSLAWGFPERHREQIVCILILGKLVPLTTKNICLKIRVQS